MTLWLKIAKNELRIRSSRFRKHRILFFSILYTLFILWAFLLTPLLFDLFMPTLAIQFAEFIRPAVALLIEYFLMIFFLMVLMWPINSVLRNVEIGFKEITLASPATAGDIFLGEFIGKLPVYSLGVLAIAPIVVGLINPILDLTIIQMSMIYVNIFGVLIFGTLVGTILASWIEHKVAQSASLRDWSRAFMMIFSVIMIVLIYSLQFFFNFLLNNPELKNWLSFYPSLWYSNLIIYVFEPALLDFYVLDVWSSWALAIIVPLLILFISYKKADAFYSLEGGIEKGGTIIESESRFYSLVRKITGKKWEGLIITQSKQFLRSKENISKLIYSTGIVCAMAIIYTIYIGNIIGELPIGIDTYIIFIMIFMGGMLFSIMFGCFIFVNSKDLLWVYKRSPRGVKSLVFSYIFAMFILILLVSVPITIFLEILYRLDFLSIILFFAFFAANCIISIIEAIGIQCIKPAFEEKGRQIAINIMSLIAVQMTCFILTMVTIIRQYDLIEVPLLQRTLFPSIIILVNSIFAIPMLVIGLYRLNRIE